MLVEARQHSGRDINPGEVCALVQQRQAYPPGSDADFEQAGSGGQSRKKRFSYLLGDTRWKAASRVIDLSGKIETNPLNTLVAQGLSSSTPVDE